MLLTIMARDDAFQQPGRFIYKTSSSFEITHTQQNRKRIFMVTEVNTISDWSLVPIVFINTDDYVRESNMYCHQEFILARGVVLLHFVFAIMTGMRDYHCVPWQAQPLGVMGWFYIQCVIVYITL